MEDIEDVDAMEQRLREKYSSGEFRNEVQEVCSARRGGLGVHNDRKIEWDGDVSFFDSVRLIVLCLSGINNQGSSNLGDVAGQEASTVSVQICVVCQGQGIEKVPYGPRVIEVKYTSTESHVSFP